MYRYISYFQCHRLTHKSVDGELYPISKNYRVILLEKKDKFLPSSSRIMFEIFREFFLKLLTNLAGILTNFFKSLNF